MKARVHISLIICIIAGVILSFLLLPVNYLAAWASSCDYIFSAPDSDYVSNSNGKYVYINAEKYLESCSFVPEDGAYSGGLRRRSGEVYGQASDIRFDGTSDDFGHYMREKCGSDSDKAGYYYVYFKDGKPFQAYWSMSEGLTGEYGGVLTEDIQSGKINEQVYAGGDRIGGYPVYVSDYKHPQGSFKAPDELLYIIDRIIINGLVFLPLIIILAVYLVCCLIKTRRSKRAGEGV